MVVGDAYFTIGNTRIYQSATWRKTWSQTKRVGARPTPVGRRNALVKHGSGVAIGGLLCRSVDRLALDAARTLVCVGDVVVVVLLCLVPNDSDRCVLWSLSSPTRRIAGMVDTRHPLCKNEQCTRQPSFGMEVRRSIPLSWGRKRRKIVGVGGVEGQRARGEDMGGGSRGGGVVGGGVDDINY